MPAYQQSWFVLLEAIEPLLTLSQIAIAVALRTSAERTLVCWWQLLQSMCCL
jgi:hypothetical protein